MTQKRHLLALGLKGTLLLLHLFDGKGCCHNDSFAAADKSYASCLVRLSMLNLSKNKSLTESFLLKEY